MIAKVKVTENIWELLDGVREVRHQIHFPSRNMEAASDTAALGIRHDAYDYTNRPCADEEHEGGIVELWLYGENRLNDIRQVLAYRPVYILNDEGKTIERI
jgi:hypothetical protein